MTMNLHAQSKRLALFVRAISLIHAKSKKLGVVHEEKRAPGHPNLQCVKIKIPVQH